MDELVNFLSRVKSGELALPPDKASAKQAIILPILRRLGWDVEDLRCVEPEHSTASGSVDYCLHAGNRKIFLEAKRPGVNLEEHQQQLLRYSFDEGASVAVITDGTTWSFFLPGATEVSWQERKFYTIDVGQQETDQVADMFASLLDLERVKTGEALRKAQELFKGKEKEKAVREHLPKAWEQLVSRKDELLIELVNDTLEKLCGYRAEPETIAGFVTELSAKPLGFTQVPIQQPPVPRRRAAHGEESASYINTQPKAFAFRGRRMEVASWADLLVDVCQLVYLSHKAEFRKCLDLHGTKNQYFSEGSPHRSMKQPRHIPDTRFYVGTKLHADATVARCRQLLRHFGYKDTDLQIEAR